MDDLIEELQTLALTLRRPAQMQVSKDLAPLFDTLSAIELAAYELREQTWNEYYAERDK